MTYRYQMPTTVFFGNNCIIDNSQALTGYGQKALIVTGRSSAKGNGSLADIVKALKHESLDYAIFDRVMANPTVAICYEGAAFAREHDADFIVAIGGGSALDAAKAMALLAKQEIPRDQLFKPHNSGEVLPLVAVPTTAGTGSEVTQYAILTNDVAETKTSLSTPLIFPKVAYVDPKYMTELPLITTVHTAVDALSHAVEGMLSVRSSELSDTLARESIRLFAKCAPSLCSAVANGSITAIDDTLRKDLAQCSLLAGMIIAQTGTTVVHAMGYSLTYYKDIDHGRANGLLLVEYMRLVSKEDNGLVEKILEAMNLAQVDDFKQLLQQLLGPEKTISAQEINLFSSKATRTANINNSQIKPSEADIQEIYLASFS